MEHTCDHSEGSPQGKCSICERTVCSECYREIFNTTICDQHEALEEESEWVLVGFYSDATALADRRFLLEDNGITSLIVETEEDANELYVPNDEKEDAYASLSSSATDSSFCGECRIEYSKDLTTCPMCGGLPDNAQEVEGDS